MRCLACNVMLSDFEATRKYAESGKYVDICNSCLHTVPDFPNTIERSDLMYDEIIDQVEGEDE